MHRAIARAPLAVLLVLVACGGHEPPPRPPEVAHVEPPKAPKPALRMNSELGTVDPAAVKQVFHKLNDKFADCQKQATARVELIAGSVKFFLRIGPEGVAKWAYLEESDVGDHAAERCLLDALMMARWPQPEGGGDAEAHYGMELPLMSRRPPNDWDSDKVSKALDKRASAIDKCKAGASATFHATMYVGPGGKVLAAGVIAAGKDTDDQVDCLAGVLEKLKGLPSPGSWPAKVSFSL